MRPIILTLALPAILSSAPYLITSPTFNGRDIVFEFAGDLWSVPAEGGDARHLTTGAGFEWHPIFSPDGKQIAFNAEYDGRTNVYVMPAAGGEPRRITYTPTDFVIGWTPDGKRLIFSSNSTSPTAAPKLFTVPAGGGFPEPLPLPSGNDASYAPDGRHVAYIPGGHRPGQDTWRGYRGGNTSKIWIADLADSSIVPIPRDNSNDFNPMWIGDRIYFLSDRNGPVALFYYDTRRRTVTKTSETGGFDLKSASAGPGAIVCDQFGAMTIFDLATGKSRPVPLHIPGDFPEARAHAVNVSKRLTHPSISPRGLITLFEARGEILAVPSGGEEWRNLSNTPGANERSPAWSPDGKTIAYLTDESGEYQLKLRQFDGSGEDRVFKLGETPAYHCCLNWAPDGKKISYLDNAAALSYMDLDQHKSVLVDRASLPGQLQSSWSPDNNWLAYNKTLANGLSAIFLYSLATAKSTQVTDGMTHAEHPVFDRSGKYLYFTASADAGPSLEWDAGSYSRQSKQNVYLVVLSKDDPTPFPPAGTGSGQFTYSLPIRVDLDRIAHRIVALPLPESRYAWLVAGDQRILFAQENPGSGPAKLHRYDVANQSDNVVLENADEFEVSFNGKKVLFEQGDKWIVSSSESPGDKGSQSELATANLEVPSDPRAEWREMFHDAWRIERDFFYDPHYHGLDLQAAAKKYEPFLENIVSRDGLNTLFQEMLGELRVSHMAAPGGDYPSSKHVKPGLLGADYKIENGRYRIGRIYEGNTWANNYAPLAQVGLDVKAGDYLLAINGRELRASDSIDAFLDGLADRQVTLKIGPDPSGEKAHRITVVPVDDERGLRVLTWMEDNRSAVDRLSNGRIAYIPLHDTGATGYSEFIFYFYAQLDKDAVIVDERFNSGGHFATDLVEYLMRPQGSFTSFRAGGERMQPYGAIQGPKVMLINEMAMSGGDALPWYFHRAGAGKLVGKRTFGGLVGVSSHIPALLDGGEVHAPDPGFWSPGETLAVESHGVAPDVEVELDPKGMRAGHDTQLEKAVEVLLDELKKNPAPKPNRPPYPDYHPN